MPSDFATYDPAALPPAFGLNNNGALCYMNSFMQALLSCTSFTDAVRASSEMDATETGRAVKEFVAAAFGPAPIATTSRILIALVNDLQARKPGALKYFGSGQQSASEFCDLLLEMIERPGGPTGMDHPVSRLFYHRSRCRVFCRSCEAAGAKNPGGDEVVDTKSMYFYGHYDGIRPVTSQEFSENILYHVSPVEDYRCERCNAKGGALRMYRITFVPEIFICHFNLYQTRAARYFPLQMRIPSGAGEIPYRLVGQVEHSGGLGGGHYTARVERRDAQNRVATHRANDSAVSAAEFGPSHLTYILVYHACDRAA